MNEFELESALADLYRLGRSHESTYEPHTTKTNLEEAAKMADEIMIAVREGIDFG